MRWRRILLTSGFVVVVWFVATQGYRRWVDQRRDALSKTCRAAREAERWDDLELTALDWAAWDGRSGPLDQGPAGCGRHDSRGSCHR